MKTTIILAALLVAAPVFAALQDNTHGATRHRYMPKNLTKPHSPSRRAVTKKSACAAKKQALALASSASVSSVSTQSTASTYSTRSAAAAAATTPVPAPAPVEAPTTTTSHIKTTSTTQDQPADTPKSGSDNNGGYGGGGDGNGDQFQGGDGTFYATGLGACGGTNVDTDFIAAVAYGTWDNYQAADGNSNHNKLCGRMVRVHYQGKSVEVQLVDLCAGCDIATSLDFSPSAFNVLADPATGRIHDISWDFI